MKKILTSVIILLLVFGLIACNGPADKTEEIAKTEPAPAETEEPAEEEEEPAEEEEEPAEEEEEPAEEEEEPATGSDASFEGPYIITTCGQSPGAVQIGMAAGMADKTAEHNNTLTVDDFDTSAYKTLIITTGTSMKGMGAAGTDVNAEIDRCVSLAEKAKDAGLFVIGAHVEGMARRTDQSDQASIDAIMPLSDLILIVKESDSDGFFTDFAEENDVELVVVDNAIDIGSVLN